MLMLLLTTTTIVVIAVVFVVVPSPSGHENFRALATIFLPQIFRYNANFSHSAAHSIFPPSLFTASLYTYPLASLLVNYIFFLLRFSLLS